MGEHAADLPVAHTILQAFGRTPDATAIVAGDRRVSYADLAAMVGGMRARLDHLDVGDRVAVCAGRSPEGVAAFVGCLSLGVCCVLVDPEQPAGRIAEMLAICDPTAVATDRDVDTGLPTISLRGLSGPDSWQAKDGLAPETAYMIFTSGSTGVPKAVMISHANLAGYLASAARTYGITESDRVLQVASPGFDWSISEIYPTLAAGATLVLRQDDALASAAHLARFVDRQGLTMLHLPTAVWHALAPDFIAGRVELPASVRHLTIGAEQAHLDTVRAWAGRFGDRVRLMNAYGPTECTIEATLVDVAGPGGIDLANRSTVPIGRPVAGCHVYVLDDERRPVATGDHGRIFIGGWGVGQGYFREPELTARRFVPDPFRPGSERVYDTGDLGRWTEFGDLEFVGRVDNQLKISGYRVDLEEIEARLTHHDAVREAAVAFDRETQTLSACLVTGGRDVPDDLRVWLGNRLPTHMIPARIVGVDAIPRTGNDKIDRAEVARLCLPDLAGAEPTAAGSDLEARIAGIWSRVLGRDEIDPDADFFKLGGHSLLAIKLVGLMNKHLGATVELRDLFQTKTIAGLARRVRERARPGQDSPDG